MAGQLKILERELNAILGGKPRRAPRTKQSNIIAIFPDGKAYPFRWDSNIKRYMCATGYQNSSIKGLKEDILAFEPGTTFEKRK